MTVNLIEAQKKLSNLVEPNEFYGGSYDKYFFMQSDYDVVVHFPLPEGTTKHEVTVSISTNNISVCVRTVKNSGSLLDGELYKPIKASESSWSIEDRRELVLTLVKMDLRLGDEWWPCVVKGEPQVDMKKFIPPPGRIQDLDEEGQMVVGKMMQEQVERRSRKAG